MLNYEAALSAYLLMSHALPLGQEFLALRPSQIRETFGPENQAKTRCSAWTCKLLNFRSLQHGKSKQIMLFMPEKSWHCVCVFKIQDQTASHTYDQEYAVYPPSEGLQVLR